MRKKVLVAMPRQRFHEIPGARDSVENMNATMARNGVETVFHRFESSVLHWSRNQLTKNFLESDADYLLFVDSDMCCNENTGIHLLLRMEQNPHIDVLSALYFMRGWPNSCAHFVGPRTPEGGMTDIERKLHAFCKRHPEFMGPDVLAYTMPNMDANENTLHEIDTTGFGCVMIRRKVMETVRRPWFCMLAGGTGEDTYFCIKARNAGFRIFVDFSCLAGHYTLEVITTSHFYRAAEQRAQTEETEMPPGLEAALKLSA